jgi:hypothetical protein
VLKFRETALTTNAINEENWGGLNSKAKNSVKIINKNFLKFKIRHNRFAIMEESFEIFVHSTCAWNTLIHGMFHLEVDSKLPLVEVATAGEMMEMINSLFKDQSKNEIVYNLIKKYDLQHSLKINGNFKELDCHTFFSRILHPTLEDTIQSSCLKCGREKSEKYVELKI